VTALQDLFVGATAIVVGFLLMAGAILNSPTLMALTKSQRLAEALGKTVARWVIAAVGGASIMIGALIASGWRIRW